MKTVTIIGEDSRTKTLIIAALSDRLSIELQDYTPEALTSIIPDRTNTAIYIAREAEEESIRVATAKLAAPSLILVGNKEITGLQADLFVPFDQLSDSSGAITGLRSIRSFIEMGDMALPELTVRQRQILELHCLLMPAKQAMERAGICRRTYQSTLEELKTAFNVPSTHELRQLFCSSKIPN